ncbi:MAG: SAM-dependent DNA methyltransferase [Promethearchaeota archaeon]|nr:MAG: SAM-dependent DNA methyltransferase [Candidatus Lokiarchaeota archaeon]
MKANLNLVHRICSEKGAPLENVLLEAEIEEFQLDIFDYLENESETSSYEYCINIQNNVISVYGNYLDKHISLFTQDFQKLSKTRSPYRRVETFENQKKKSVLALEWIEFLEFLEERDCDWIFSLLKSPHSCNSTDFARLFGYNSFFHRWFVEIPKKPSVDRYNLWKSHFQEIYHDSNIKKELYWTHFYITLICKQIIEILQSFLEEQIEDFSNLFSLQKWLGAQFFDYNSNMELKPLISSLKKALKSIIFSNTPNRVSDLLNLFYQELLTFSRRHSLGEFYTNEELCREMVEECFSPGNSVLDPCCGSGTFLLEMLNSISEKGSVSDILKLHGIDINPLSVIITRINLTISFFFMCNRRKDLNDSQGKVLPTLISNISQGDYLQSTNTEKFDLIIGNPPWIVINGINSNDYKDYLKSLAKSMRISTDTQNISNLEVSSLFLEKTSSRHMKPGSKLSLVVSAGILTGSQNERVRRFNHLKQIQVWKFAQDLFNVHNICILAKYGNQPIQQKYRILAITKDITENSQFCTKRTQTYVPAYIRSGGKFQSLPEMTKEPDSDEWGIGRYIPEQKKTLNVKKSEYHDKFRQGACIGPRNLLFVSKYSKPDSSICEIRPDPLIKSKKYGGWDYAAYVDAKIEKKYLHSIAKSTELIPFFILRFNTAFLPISHGFENSDMLMSKKNPLTPKDIGYLFGQDEYAKSHYSFLHSIYSKNIKSGGAIPDLFLNMNYNNKLLQENQRISKKVVYNGIGSKVKAAYLDIDAVIDSSLYYYIPKSELEAYYLVGVLNSPTLTDFTNQMGSTGAGGSLRNIHKNPLKCNIFQYIGTPTQKMIAKLAMSIESYVHKYCLDVISEKIRLWFKREFCPKCGELFDQNKYSSHYLVCKQTNNFKEMKIVLDSFTQEEKSELSSKDTIFKLLLHGPIQISEILKDKARVLLSLVIKPKTLQNHLRKDELFNQKIKVLDLTVKSLWK